MSSQRPFDPSQPRPLAAAPKASSAPFSPQRGRTPWLLVGIVGGAVVLVGGCCLVSSGIGVWYVLTAGPVTLGGPQLLAGGSDAKNRAEAVDRLQRISKAMFDHHSAFHAYPAGIVARDGQLGLSWRVQLLAYMGKEEEKLFSQFKLDEPWDGPTNKNLIAKMPDVYASPGKNAAPGKTHLRSFVGEMAFLHGTAPRDGNAQGAPAVGLPGTSARGRRIADITDGTSNTLAVAEAAEPVEWTKPDDLPCYGYRLAKTPDLPKVPKLGGVYASGFHGLMADGKVVFFPADLPESDLRALITATAGDEYSPRVSKVLYPNGIPEPAPASPLKGGK